ncbi:MAG TPA: hypothetical protein VGF75_06800, partial [Candidatus Saccharimonadales bacterium]
YCREHHPSNFPNRPRDELEIIDEKDDYEHVDMPETTSPCVEIKRSTPIPIPKRRIIIIRKK